MDSEPAAADHPAAMVKLSDAAVKVRLSGVMLSAEEKQLSKPGFTVCTGLYAVTLAAHCLHIFFVK